VCDSRLLGPAELFNGQLSFIGSVPLYTLPIVPAEPNQYVAQWAVNNHRVYDEYCRVNCTTQNLFKGVLKYSVLESSLYDSDILCEAYDFMYLHFYPVMCGSTTTPWDDCVSNLNKQSSCGYPYSTAASSKGLLIEKRPDIMQEIFERLDDFDQKLIPFCFKASTKDENRKVEKIDDPRVFCGAPTDHNLYSDYYLGNMEDKLMAAQTWSFVGHSKEYGGWDDLARRILKHPHIFSMDMKKYDTTIPSVLMWDKYRFRAKCLLEPSERDLERLAYLYEAMINTYLVFGSEVKFRGIVMRKFLGRPSGCLTTTTDNTLDLFQILSYCYIRSMRDNNQKYSYDHFMDNVEAALNGDDNLFSVSDELLPYYNPQTIMKYALELGMLATTDNDGMAMKLTETEFLSHKFVLFKGRYYPSPDYQKVMCSLLVRSDEHDIRWTLMRAFALRIQSYWNIDCRRDLEQFIAWAFAKYHDALIGEFKGIAWKTMKSSYFTDRQIIQLYSGYEYKRVIDDVVDGAVSHLIFSLQSVSASKTSTPNKKKMTKFDQKSNAQHIYDEANELVDSQVELEDAMLGPGNHDIITRGVSKVVSTATAPVLYGINKILGNKSNYRARRENARIKRQQHENEYLANNRANLEAREPLDARFHEYTRGFTPARMKGVAPRTPANTNKKLPKKMLVGVELNPGPAKNAKAKPKLKLKTIVKKVVKQNNKRKKATKMRPVFSAVQRAVNNASTSFVRKPYARRRQIRLRECEYINEFSSSGTSINTHFDQLINPCNSSVFPYLSTIANSFEQYIIHKLKFYVKTEATTSTPGSVMLVCNYDPSASAFTTKQQIMEYEGAVRGAPWQSSVEYTYRPKNALNRKMFNLYGSLPSSVSVNDYYAGRMQMFSTNVTTGLIVGELYVEYDISLMEPVNSANMYKRYQLPTQGIIMSSTGATTPWGAGVPTAMNGYEQSDSNPMGFGAGNQTITIRKHPDTSYRYFVCIFNVHDAASGVATVSPGSGTTGAIVGIGTAGSHFSINVTEWQVTGANSGSFTLSVSGASVVTRMFGFWSQNSWIGQFGAPKELIKYYPDPDAIDMCDEKSDVVSLYDEINISDHHEPSFAEYRMWLAMQKGELKRPKEQLVGIEKNPGPYFAAKEFLRWCKVALDEPLTYHKTRKDLLEALKKIKKSFNKKDGDEWLYVTNIDYIVIRNFLDQRSSAINDSSLLAFTTTVAGLLDQTGEEEEVDEAAAADEG